MYCILRFNKTERDSQSTRGCKFSENSVSGKFAKIPALEITMNHWEYARRACAMQTTMIHYCTGGNFFKLSSNVWKIRRNLVLQCFGIRSYASDCFMFL